MSRSIVQKYGINRFNNEASNHNSSLLLLAKPKLPLPYRTYSRTYSIFVDKYNLNQHNRSYNGLFITLSLFTAFPNVGFIRISIYFLFCWNSQENTKYVKQKIAAVIVQRTEGGPLGPPQSSAQ